MTFCILEDQKLTMKTIFLQSQNDGASLDQEKKAGSDIALIKWVH